MVNGCNAQALGPCSHAEGSNTIASGFTSHAEGSDTIASGFASHAEGYNTVASGETSHAEGRNTQALGSVSHAEGESSIANGFFSHAEGLNTRASGDSSQAEGQITTASGPNSHSEGQNTTASGNASHAEGQNSSAIGQASHAEGVGTTSSGLDSHSEGLNTISGGLASHTEGFATSAFGVGSHSEGLNTNASGAGAHAEGQNTTSGGTASHTEGFGTVTNGAFSHTEGELTNDNGKIGVHVMGQNGGPALTDPDFSWYLVNGALGGVVAKILNNGDACFEGTLRASVITPGPVACDYAEMFEISGDEWIDVGYFVTFDNSGDKIRKACASDDYIVGITSSNPGFLADIHDPSCSKFLLNKWNQPIYEEVVIPAVMDSEGKVIVEERKEITRKLNPAWDQNKGCRSRLDSVEWVPVGLLGKLLTRDDGSCKVGGYCWPNEQGIATASAKGYRVMKRTGLNQILVLLR